MSRTIAVLIALCFSAALLAGTAFAEETSHEKAVIQLLDLMRIQDVMDKNIDALLDMQVKQNKDLAPYKEVMRKFLKKYMSYESLKAEFTKLYVEEFSEPEINDMIAFYNTPTGKKALVKLPTLAARGSEIGMAQIQGHLDELKTMVSEEALKQPAKKP